MSLKIRLSRGGAKKRPFYRVVVADSRFPRDGRFIERIGIFDPLKAKDATDRLVLDVEKAKAWMQKGAQPTDRVARLLDGLGLMKREARNNPQKALPKKKAQERSGADAKAAEAAAAAPAAELPPPDGEGPHSRRTIWRRARRQRRAAAQILYAGQSGDCALWRAFGRERHAAFRNRALRPLKDDLFVARVKGIETREAAEALTNTALYVTREKLPAAEEEEFYHADLIGLAAKSEAGETIGTIVAVLNFGGGDILEIAPVEKGETLLLPFTKAAVPVVDVAQGHVIVVPPVEVDEAITHTDSPPPCGEGSGVGVEFAINRDDPHPGPPRRSDPPRKGEGKGAA